jgi:hypothetical protein
MYKRVPIFSLAVLLLLLSAGRGGARATPPQNQQQATATVSTAGGTEPASSQGGSASTAQSRTISATAPFRVTSIDMSVTPATLNTWVCGSSIQAVYTAVFHLTSGPNGGLMKFSYSTNGGRATTPAQLTILPGQVKTDFVFTWQGPLPADHTAPGLGGVSVTYPNAITSKLVKPAGACR